MNVPTIAAVVGRILGRVFGPVPGWYMVTVEPFARRSTAVVTAASPSGAAMELHLAEFVQRKHYFHSYERREIAFLHRFLREGDVYVDVGANVGVLVCEGAASVGATGRTIAVEPVPDNVERLRANAALQVDRRVVVVQAACGSTTGRLALGLTEQQAEVGNMGSYSASATGSNAADGSSVEVPLRRLDDIVDDDVGPDTTVRLLKIDVEGMEAEVLRGAVGTARLGSDRRRPLRAQQRGRGFVARCGPRGTRLSPAPPRDRRPPPSRVSRGAHLRRVGQAGCGRRSVGAAAVDRRLDPWRRTPRDARRTRALDTDGALDSTPPVNANRAATRRPLPCS